MRTIRVYSENGDFEVEVPDTARMSFGYFNPTRSEDGAFNPQASRYGDHRRTCLRIYDGPATDKNQIACFLGVVGFRDEKVRIAKAQKDEHSRPRSRRRSPEKKAKWTGGII